MSTPRPSPPSRRAVGRERWCIALLAAGVVAALALPAVPQDAAYHAFADQRALLGVARGADVLSSLAFLVVGLAAIARLVDRGRSRFAASTEAALACVAAGLALTALGSAAYHLDPRDTTLVWDRMPMTLGFAGVLAVAIAQRVSGRAAALALPLLVVLGVASVLHWRASGNLTPYVVLQAGTAAAIVLLAALAPARDDPFPWRWVIAWYALAKAFELADAVLWDASGGLVAGHALKHLAAAAAGAAALWPLAPVAWRRRVSRRT